jgi:hypothetical protein
MVGMASVPGMAPVRPVTLLFAVVASLYTCVLGVVLRGPVRVPVHPRA